MTGGEMTDKDEMIKKLVGSLRRIQQLLGPSAPTCCPGCESEITEALEVIREAIGPEDRVEWLVLSDADVWHLQDCSLQPVHGEDRVRARCGTEMRVKRRADVNRTVIGHVCGECYSMLYEGPKGGAVGMKREWAEAAFILAGLEPRGESVRVENGYWPDTDDHYRLLRSQNPWWMVFTEYGPMVIGRRKRVWFVSWKGIEWLRTQDVAEGGDTSEDYLFHAWTEESLVKYLKKLHVIALVRSRRGSTEGKAS